MTVNRRTHSRSHSRGHQPSRTQAERREHTRRALLDAALKLMDAGESFESVSLRSVTRTAGVVPGAFYRHFSSMDELALALVDESFRTLRALLREARAAGPPPQRAIRRSVGVLVEQVLANRQHFTLIARARTSGNGVLRHAVNNEIRLITSELATDLARFPVLRDWSTADLQMLAGLFVDVMIAAIEAMVEVAGGALDPEAPAPEGEAEIAALTAKRLRLIVLAIPHWRSSP